MTEVSPSSMLLQLLTSILGVSFDRIWVTQAAAN